MPLFVPHQIQMICCGVDKARHRLHPRQYHQSNAGRVLCDPEDRYARLHKGQRGVYIWRRSKTYVVMADGSIQYLHWKKCSFHRDLIIFEVLWFWSGSVGDTQWRVRETLRVAWGWKTPD